MWGFQLVLEALVDYFHFLVLKTTVLLLFNDRLSAHAHHEDSTFDVRHIDCIRFHESSLYQYHVA